MSTSGSGISWPSLLEEKKLQIRKGFGQGHNSGSGVNDSRAFRSALEKLLKKLLLKKDWREIPRLEARLLPSYRPITELARAVDRSISDLQQLAASDTLEGIVWSISFALIECGCRAGAHLDPLVTWIAELNKSVPRFTTDKGPFRLRFPNERRVQKPLQDVYGLFINLHLSILSHFEKKNLAPHGDPSRDETLKTRIAETAGQFQGARGRYGLSVNQAAEDEERDRAHIEQPSLDAERSLPDHLHQDSTANREVQAWFVSKRFLGRGSYGEVDEVRELSTGASYARKHIHLDADERPDVIENEVKNEVAVMQKLRHLHIATVLFYLKEKNAYSIFMLPVADCDLQRFLIDCTEKKYDPALTKQINPWFGCLLDALAYAHKLNIKHRDIKLSNILIKNDQPYLCDFGLAKEFEDPNASTSRGPKPKGTIIYRAPEVVAGNDRGRKADVFALGCVYSEMFTVTQEKSLEDYREARSKAGSTAFRDCLPEVQAWLRGFESNKLSDLLVDQILSMIKRDARERHTSEQAVNFLKRERAFFCVE